MIYEYACPVCERVSEVEHGMSETPVVECDNLHSRVRCVRMISGCNFILKGQGWAKDGYSAPSGGNDQ